MLCLWLTAGFDFWANIGDGIGAGNMTRRQAGGLVKRNCCGPLLRGGCAGCGRRPDRENVFQHVRKS